MVSSKAYLSSRRKDRRININRRNRRINLERFSPDLNAKKLLVQRTEAEGFLMSLAFKLQCRNKTSCKYIYAFDVAEEYAKCNPSKRIKARKLIHTCILLGLLTRDNSKIKFGINRSFQEYFAALKLKTYLENGVDISKTFRHPRWENVITLTSELLESGEELVNSIISSGNLYLASKCAMKASAETKGKSMCLTCQET